MSARSTLPPRFDRLDPAVLLDPYQRYKELRAEGPLARGGPGAWLVARHSDVARLLADRRLGNAVPDAYHQIALGDGVASAFFGRILFYRDPPAHTRLRRLLAAGFTPRLVGAAKEPIRRLVDELLVPAAARGRIDAIRELANPLALSVICLLIGIPRADERELLPRAADIALGFTVSGDERQRARTDAAVQWLEDYLAELLDSRARHPGNDLLSRMLGASRGDGALTRADIVDNCAFLFWAGFETVVSVIGTACVALAEYPDQFGKLRSRPELIRSAVEELLRFDAPIQGTARIVREPLQIGRHRIRSGRMLVLLIGSANRDETVFRDPDTVDVARSPNPHLSFGGGHHTCLGNVLARVEAAVVIEQLLRRCARIDVAGPIVRRTDSTAMRFHASVPLRLTPSREEEK